MRGRTKWGGGKKKRKTFKNPERDIRATKTRAEKEEEEEQNGCRVSFTLSSDEDDGRVALK